MMSLLDNECVKAAFTCRFANDASRAKEALAIEWRSKLFICFISGHKSRSANMTHFRCQHSSEQWSVLKRKT